MKTSLREFVRFKTLPKFLFPFILGLHVTAYAQGFKDVVCVFEKINSAWNLTAVGYSLSAFDMRPGQTVDVFDYHTPTAFGGGRPHAACMQLEGTGSTGLLRVNGLHHDAQRFDGIKNGCLWQGVDIRLLRESSANLARGKAFLFDIPWPTEKNGALRLVEYLATVEEMNQLDERLAARICEKFFP